MGNLRARLGFGLVVALLGALLFIVASAYVVDHGYAKVAAAIVGALAFPVAPLGWHFVAERRRGKRLADAKSTPKAMLTGHDRFWLRFVLVALAVLGPMFASSRLGVFGAVWRHGLWFVPEKAPRPVMHEEPLLRHVPGEAELLFVVRTPPMLGNPARSAVYAWGARQAMLATDPGFTALANPLEQLDASHGKLRLLPFEPLADIATEDHSVLGASALWRPEVELGHAGPSDELRDELDRAPADAPFVMAFTPRTKISIHDLEPDTIRHGVVWIERRAGSIVLASRIEMVDAATAVKLHDELTTALAKEVPAACRDQVAKVHLDIQQDGAVLTTHAEIASDTLVGLMSCAGF
jgi:hypothetical protein